MGGKADNFGTSINKIMKNDRTRLENLDEVIVSLDLTGLDCMEEALEECSAFNSKIIPLICRSIVAITEVNDPVFQEK